MPPFWLTGKGAYFFLYNRKLRSCYIEKLRRDVHSRDVVRATRRRRRILQNRILSCRKYCVMSKNEKLNALYEKFSVLSSTP